MFVQVQRCVSISRYTETAKLRTDEGGCGFAIEFSAMRALRIGKRLGKLFALNDTCWHVVVRGTKTQQGEQNCFGGVAR